MLKIELPVELAPKLRSVAHVHGLPVDARSVTDEIMQKERA
jgi:2-oxoglutarate ferredoxin oxidoreductase subunit alpha